MVVSDLLNHRFWRQTCWWLWLWLTNFHKQRGILFVISSALSLLNQFMITMYIFSSLCRILVVGENDDAGSRTRCGSTEPPCILYSPLNILNLVFFLIVILSAEYSIVSPLKISPSKFYITIFESIRLRWRDASPLTWQPNLLVLEEISFFLGVGY